MKDGTKYEFEGNQGGTVIAGMVRGISGGKAVAIPLTDVDKVLVRKSDAGLTILAVVAASAIIIGVAVGSLKQSLGK